MLVKQGKLPALESLTPWLRVEGIDFKREDLFAPWGEGWLNGGKLRSCFWILGKAAELGYEGIVTGASVKSPQLSMTTAVASSYGMKAVQVIGSRLETARRRPQVAIAEQLGAEFVISKIAYNPGLQKLAREEAARRGYFYLEYGITTSNPEWIEGFHALGGGQVANMPDVTDLVVPAGSCNSLVNILYGIWRYRPRKLQRIHMVAIGPSRQQWVEERLSHLGCGDVFLRRYKSGERYNLPGAEARYELLLHDLHAAGVSYQDEVPWSIGSIKLHPTYEGKVGRWLAGHHWPRTQEGVKVGFWIVGSEVKA